MTRSALRSIPTIYLLPRRISGGALAVAPTGTFRSLTRLFATMSTETGSSAPAHSNGVATANGTKTKLHGRAFYESIGSPKMILAPMVEQSEFVCLFKSPLSTRARKD